MAFRVAAVVVAAGRGTRAGLDYPKQYKMMGGTPMVRASLRPCEPGARRGKRAEPELRQHAGAARVPGVRNDEAARLVETPKLETHVLLGEHGDRIPKTMADDSL